MTNQIKLGQDQFRLLLVDDDPPTLQLLETLLKDPSYELSTATCGQDAMSMLKNRSFDLVIADIQLGDINGLEMLSFVKESKAATLVVFITGQGDVKTAVSAIQAGAFEYVTKSLNLADVAEELKSVIQRARLQNESVHGSKVISVNPVPQGMKSGMIGKSPQMGKVFRSIARAARCQSTVLINGESGTGKELVASAIHDNSDRAAKPFITVNCGALTETLLEAELFGHVKGAFTGAMSNRTGLFDEADGGTLFLDEIGDVTAGLQVKLLRVLQEGEFKPVGANENRRVDVRIVAATHRDLLDLVRQGKFREDLYYRLKVIPIEIAPLRERPQDIPDLVHYFLGLNAQKNGRPSIGISEEAMALLCSHSWPGNVRELENAIERAVAMTTADILFAEDFSEEMHREPKAEETTEAKSVERSGYSLDDVERDHILRTLREVNFNKSKAAQLLGIDRVTLYRKVLRYSLPSSEEASAATK